MEFHIMFAGTLKQMDLSEVLKLLAASHQTGVLKLMNPETGQGSGMIYLQVGQVVDVQVGQATGLDGLSASCAFWEEAFAFEEHVMAPQQTLAAYPTAKLIEKMAAQIGEAKALRVATPLAEEVPVYLAGASLAGLDATADDLSLLILCNGQRKVSDLARDSRRGVEETARAIAKFRMAGIVEVKATAAPAVQAVQPAQPAIPSVGATDPGSGTSRAEASVDPNKPVRYWRGKPIQ
ncbi:MAG: DUF4388 domain-containing protein [Blastochloris sp.]|nr:DUF4388 domain-containing protein [Blastochloris sp.]